MSIGPVTVNHTFAAMNEDLYVVSAYASEMLDIIMRVDNVDLTDSDNVANLMSAYQFFQALKKGDKFTDPTGRILDLSSYKKAGGFFGVKMADLQDRLNKVENKITS